MTAKSSKSITRKLNRLISIKFAPKKNEIESAEITNAHAHTIDTH